MGENLSFISQPPLWDSFTARIFEVTNLALRLMRNASTLPEDEVDLNIEFGHCVREALWQLKDSDEGFDFTPSYDGLNQPHGARGKHDKKKPDLQWIMKNSHAQTQEEHFRVFAMECKRLGRPSSKSWVLNRLYITNGVCRFIKAEYSYGSPKYNPSYAMVGYVQSMALDDILKEVNESAKACSVSAIKLPVDGWKEKDISRLAQQHDRPEIHDTPLTLHHLWIDIRDIQMIPAKKTNTTKRRAKGSKKNAK